ncbi:MAG: TldD/PmbA family protein [Actinobacteria bacterium]|nr:TldD/PmbA family protein [Actinomycetota bacterium]
MREKKSKILDYCDKAAGMLAFKNAGQFEVYGISSTHNEAGIFNENIENLSFSDTKGLGIRIFKNGRIGYSYTSNLEDSEIKECIERAADNSEVSTEDIYNYLPEESEFFYPKEIVDRKCLFSEKFNDFSIEQKIEIAKSLEKKAKKIDKRVSAVADLIYDDSISETAIVNSAGFRDSYKSTSAFLYISVISRDDSDTSTGDYFDCARDMSSFDIDDIAYNAVTRSTSLLGAKKIKSQKMDLLLDSFVSAQFLQVLAGILTADAVQKGRSLFRGRIESRIFNKNINIIDDGTLSYGLSSRPFDSEGVPKGKTVVFEDGVLKTYLYNSYTARKDKRPSTGNAARASYKSPPHTGISNFYLLNGITSFSDMIKKTNRGLYVTDIIGVHSGINPISGQISVGAKGLLIEKGGISCPVKEITIATDILSFCSSITDIGNDLKFMPAGGYTGSPSVLVKNITVSGS